MRTLSVMLLLSCVGGPPQSAADSGGTTSTTPPEQTDTSAVSNATTIDGRCPNDVDFGGIEVQQLEYYSAAQGFVTDGVVPISLLEEVLADGDCRVMRQNNPHCEPACEGDDVCDQNGDCIEYPLQQDLGTVVIDGLVKAVSMEPLPPGYNYFDTTLPNPPYEVGAEIVLNLPSSDFGPTTLNGIGVAPLAVSATPVELFEDQDLLIEWTAATEDAMVSLSLNIDQHGLSPASIQCDFADSGQGVVPSAVVNGLITQGVTGFPTATLSRQTQDHHLASGGCLDFTVVSRRSIPVEVDGFTPCISDRDCPDGLKCNVLLQICE